MTTHLTRCVAFTVALAAASSAPALTQTKPQERPKPMTHRDLVAFFQQWREFQKPNRHG